MKKIFLFCFLICIVLMGVAQTPLTTAVQIDAKDYKGIPHNLFDYLDNGKHVLLSFYTLNCGSCQEYSPHVNIIYEQFGCNNGDVIVLGVNWGSNNSQLEQHHQQNGYNFPALSGFEGYGNEINEAYQIQSFISLILIAPGHEIVNQYIYPPSITILENVLFSYGLNAMVCTVGSETNLTHAKIQPLVYPNPAGAIFNLSMGKEIGGYDLSVYDLTGRLIRTYNEELNQASGYSLAGIPAGVYVVKISNINTTYSTRLVVMP